MDPKRMADAIDHTLLKPTATWPEYQKLCAEAKNHNFVAVCVPPVFVKGCVQELDGSAVRVATVIGFPLGYQASASKALEARLAVEDGAVEIDMVQNIAWAKEGRWGELEADISAVVKSTKSANHQALVKVIIETCYLTDEEKVRSCLAAVAAGADFVKTSTGFGSGGATVQDVELMRKTVGDRLGVKASGGVRSPEQAVAMLNAGASRLGTSSGVGLVGGSAH